MRTKLKQCSMKSMKSTVSHLAEKLFLFKLNLTCFVDVSDLPLSSFGFLEKEEALDPMRKLHVQEDGTILAVGATGTSSQSSLMTWVRILERENPRLRSIPVIISNRDHVPPPQGIDDSSAKSGSAANEQSQ